MTTRSRSRSVAVVIFSLVTTCVVALSAPTARADETRCGATVTDLALLNAAIAEFITDPACNLIEFGRSFEIDSAEPFLEQISLIAIDPIEAPTAMTKELTIDGKGFVLTGDSIVSGFVVYLGSPDGSNTLTIRNLGMSGFGGSGAVSVVSGATVIERSLFTNNTFQSTSPIPGMDGASAGAINAVGRLVVTQSQFEGNTGFEGGAIHSAPSLVPQLVPAGAALPPVQISGSTFTDNEASTAGGAIYTLQSLVMSNSTVTGNSGGSAGALNVDGSISLNFCTIVENVGSGLGAAVSATSAVDISHSILYLNTPEDVSSVEGETNVTSSLVTSSDSITSTLYATVLDDSNIVGEDPLLSPLGDFGGFALPSGATIQTRPPQIDSPIIDTIELVAVGNGDGLTDQRGPGFPRFVNGRADMGAVENWPIVVPDPLTDPTNPVPDFDDFRWSLNLEKLTHLPDTS